MEKFNCNINKTRSNSPRTNRADTPSRDEIHREVERTRDEIRTENQPERANGAFKCFVNWVSGLFSKNDEPNLEQGATMRGNAAIALKADIHNTLSSDITDEGVSDPPEQGAAIPNGKIEAGEITFNLDGEERGNIFSKSGTVSILGKEISWSAERRINRLMESSFLR